MKMILVGAGQRGRIYADYIHDAKYAKFVAIVEPNAERMQAAAMRLGVPGDHCFETVESLWRLGKIADAAVIATGDRDHYAHAMRALEVGYNLLLEKPISPVLSECIDIQQHAKKRGCKVVICHVLRYTPFFSTLKSLLDGGTLGKVVSIRHEENIGNFHMAHSFVRGNWARAKESSPIILQKSCHDMDILLWLTASRAKSIASIGNLHYFIPDKAPMGSAARCCDCAVAENCRFDARRCYLPVLGNWPATVVSAVQTKAAVCDALQTGPYGRCVYRCGNDVCDSQASLIVFENGVTANFVMSAFTNRMYRSIRILCEHGEIDGNDDENRITVTRFGSNQVDAYSREEIHTQVPQSGHGGGDTVLVDGFFRTLADVQGESSSSIDQSIESHIMAWAAEESRLRCGERVDVGEFRKEAVQAQKHPAC